MMEQGNSPIKKILSIVAVIAIVFAAVYFFVFNEEAPQMVFDQFGNPVEAQVVGQDLIDLLSRLQSVNLDESIFSKDAFIQLTDYSLTLPDQPRGRSNPFGNI